MPIQDRDFRRRLAAMGKAAAEFESNDWTAIGLQTGCTDLLQNHPRLYRALSWGDDDIPDNAVQVLTQIVDFDPDNLSIIENYVADTKGEGENISTAQSKSRMVVFTPGVFEVPEGGVDKQLVAVMMPFQPEFEAVFSAIASAASRAGGRAVRAKDIWEHATVIQDVFSLIFRAQVVVCDFSGRNPNVFYEAGIAHTLGKVVLPITQSHTDIPFDVRHHRYLHYLNNGEGLRGMERELALKLSKVLPAPF